MTPWKSIRSKTAFTHFAVHIYKNILQAANQRTDYSDYETIGNSFSTKLRPRVRE